MICNGINFNEQWVLKFETADAFAGHVHCQRYINLKIVDRDTLISFYNLLSELHKPKTNDVDTGIQEQVQKNQSESSDRGNGEGESGTDSRSAGDTNVKGRKSRRNKVS